MTYPKDTFRCEHGQVRGLGKCFVCEPPPRTEAANQALLDTTHDLAIWWRVVDLAWTAADETEMADIDESLPAAVRALRQRAEQAEADRDSYCGAHDSALAELLESEQARATLQTALKAIQVDLENAYGTIPDAIEAQFAAALSPVQETPTSRCTHCGGALDGPCLSNLPS